MSDAPTLKPCPFDGNTELMFIEERDVVDGFSHNYSIRCPTCGISMHDEYMSELVERWNTRKRRLRKVKNDDQ